MSHTYLQPSPQRAARLAGLALLGSFLIPILNWVFVLSKIIVENKPIATAKNVLAHEFLFRINVLSGLGTAIVITLLSWALYVLLKPVNKPLALLGVLFRLVEVFLVTVIAFAHLVMLLILKSGGVVQGSQGQMQGVMGAFLNIYMSLTSVGGVFLGLSMLTFSYLFFKSTYIPRSIAVLGIIASALVVAYDSLVILAPDYAKVAVIQIVGSAPIVIFVLLGSFWLLFKTKVADEKI